VAIRLEQTRWFAVSPEYMPLNAVAIGLLVLALGKATHGNLFLAAFAAGITVATVGSAQREAFEHFGELVAETLKLAALLVFGALLTPAFFADIPWTGWLFAILALVVARPLALWISFLRAGLRPREQFAAMWFGPKGFASVVYGLLVLASGIAADDEIFHLVAITIVLSILAHSSTDVLVARTFDDDHLPAWRDRIHQARRRLHRTRTAPAPDQAEPGPPAS
jgi:NhaP-type Na+/H+ or K+/H+ antiporter